MQARRHSPNADRGVILQARRRDEQRVWKRAALQHESADLANKYLAYVEGNPLIKDLGENPFLPVTVGKTLTTTLTLISHKLRG